jgi:hypothetical protein
MYAPKMGTGGCHRIQSRGERQSLLQFKARMERA